MDSRAGGARVASRPPLNDATMRLNNTGGPQYVDLRKSPRPDLNMASGKPSPVVVSYASPPPVSRADSLRENDVPRVSEHLSPVSKVSQDVIESRRTSQASSNSRYSACNGFPNKKTHIGPWQLGKTLGKGSSARVRAARHCVTHQPVAVKIVAKRTAHMTQAGSLTRLDQIDSQQIDNGNGLRRMPLAIEREVGILKLIEHPNIVKIYDIWENRDEIYLILEFVEKGDLFEYINRHGQMTEEQAMYVFRQLMSAMDYCHRHNICHRDLKPENILLKADGQVKIADFGMAALQQGPHHQLRTSCGSPHYAAPELLKARVYQGAKADIWSMGVILFAMLAARLPFDEPDMDKMLAKARKGIYQMPSFFSKDAKDLVHRILQVDPNVRISMREMWQHPLVWKYGYLDDLGPAHTELLDSRGGKNVEPLNHADIDPQILRQLQAMWHTFTEQELVEKLVNNRSNDQKLFYWLLHSYRERQLENYNPSLTYSTSDYHHLRPGPWAKRVSTRQFSKRTGKGHARSVSRFTVISNVAETEAGTEGGTVRSYDPYKSSIVMRPEASQAKIVIHRNNQGSTKDVAAAMSSPASRAGAASTAARKRMHSQKTGTTGRFQSPGNSVSSLRSSRQGTPRVRANSRYKRGVDFSHVRKRSVDVKPQNDGVQVEVAEPVAADDSEMAVDSPSFRETSPIERCTIEVTPAPADEDEEQEQEEHAMDTISEQGVEVSAKVALLSDEIRHFSNSIAKAWDDAFADSLLTLTTLDGTGASREGTPFSLDFELPGSPVEKEVKTPTSQQANPRPWDSRPLPPTPPTTISTRLEILEAEAARSQRTSIANSQLAAEVGRHNKYIASLAVPETPQPDRRIVSAPAYAARSQDPRPLPAVQVNGQENWHRHDAAKPRIVSAPPKTQAGLPTPQDPSKGLHFLARAENTIRVVNSPSAVRHADPVAAPAPLNVQKKLTRKSQDPAPQNTTTTAPASVDLRQQYASWGQQKAQGTDRVASQPEAPPTPPQSTTSVSAPKKRGISSWFRKSSRTEVVKDEAGSEKKRQSTAESASSKVQRSDSQSSNTLPIPQAAAKKKGFVFPFWKASKSEQRMSLGGLEDEPPQVPERPVITKRRSRFSQKSWYDEESSGRKIEAKQNWIARLFRVKPEMRYLCLTISKRRARQEVAILLREWKKYGIKDVQVDKERNIVFARVGAKNYLNLKEVSFACEIITVIEHGKRNHLSIVRFTQEKGAASSFHKVVETMNLVFSNRNLIVADKRKAKMMIKTLNS